VTCNTKSKTKRTLPSYLDTLNHYCLFLVDVRSSLPHQITNQLASEHKQNQPIITMLLIKPSTNQVID